MKRGMVAPLRVLAAAAAMGMVAPVHSQPAGEAPAAPAPATAAAPAVAPATPDVNAMPAAEKSGQVLFEQTCGQCHSLELPSRQRLDRANWEWVINDMVTLYNCNWTTEQERAKILDYLVENFGRDKPR